MTSKVIYVLSIFLLCFSGESNLKLFVSENAGREVDQKQISQLEKPKLFLEKIIHEKVDYFGYPYGSWTKRCINELVKDEYKAAFQLSNKQSEHYPLYTIRRLMVQGNWSAATLHEKMIKTFH